MSDDPHTATISNSKSVEATSSNAYFLFVRYWPGFCEQFPYTDFDSVSDDAVDAKLWDALDLELTRRKVVQRAIERVKDETQGCREAEFMRLAGLVGWSDGLHHIESDSWPRLCTRKVCIGITESVEEAEAALVELKTQSSIKRGCEICDGDYPGWSVCNFVNPKYSYVDVRSFSRAELCGAKLTIERMRIGDTLDSLEAHAKVQLQSIDAVHDQWKATDPVVNVVSCPGTGSIGAIMEDTRERLPNPDVHVAIAEADRATYRPGGVLAREGKKPIPASEETGNYAARFVCPPCPECGSKAKVDRTAGRVRHIKCRSAKCGHRWKVSQSD